MSADDAMQVSKDHSLAAGERISEIKDYRGEAKYHVEAGFQIVTDKQTITLAIDDEACCCESWGYFLTEDDTSKFIGAELRGVTLTDVNRSTRTFVTGWDVDAGKDDIHLDDGNVMFVNVETDRGVLQFVAYNAHNGYYSHQARVSSQQVEHAEYL